MAELIDPKELAGKIKDLCANSGVTMSSGAPEFLAGKLDGFLSAKLDGASPADAAGTKAMLADPKQRDHVYEQLKKGISDPVAVASYGIFGPVIAATAVTLPKVCNDANSAFTR